MSGPDEGIRVIVAMRPTSLDRFRVNSPRPAYEANANNVDEGTYSTIKVL